MYGFYTTVTQEVNFFLLGSALLGSNLPSCLLAD